MADVIINKYTTQVVREGSTPATPGFVVSEGQDPVNPPGTNNFVPYSGAISNVDLGEFGLDTGFVTLDTTPTNIPTDQGGIYWDDSRSTAALIMNGTLQHIGQDVFYYVKNSTGSSIPKGTAVRFDGTDGASGHLLIAPFLANGTYPSSYFMGVTAEAIGNGQFGQVMHFGELSGINTSGYTAGALLYASTTVAGGFQTTAPVAPNNIVLVAAAVNSKNNGEIIVRPLIGSNINNDEGVKITSGTTGDLLQLQAGGLWENKTKAQILGGTSSQFVKGDGSLDSTSYQPLLTNPVTGTGTTNYLPKFTGASTIGNSQVFDNGTGVGIGTASPLTKLMVQDSANTYVAHFSGLNQANGIAIGTNSSNIAVIQGYTRTFSATNNIAMQADGGNVLIGTTTDSGFKLDVNGSGRFSSNLSTGNGASFTTWSTSGNVDLNDVYLSLSSSGSFGGAISNNAYFNSGWKYKAANNATLYQTLGGEHRFFTAGVGAAAGNAISFTQALTITSSGNVGIGTSSPNVRTEIAGTDAIVGLRVTTNNAGVSASNYSEIQLADNGAIRSYWRNVRDGSGATLFSYNDNLRFLSSGSEKVRITSGGNVLIGTTTDNGARLQVNGNINSSRILVGTSTASSYRISIVANSNTDTAGILMQDTNTGGRVYTIGSSITTVGNLEFFDSTAGVLRFSINSSGNARFTDLGTGTVYSNGGTLTNTNPSDYNLKTNIEKLAYGLDEILKLNPVSFNWKNDTINQGKQFGFIAQEVQKVMPELVKEGDYLGLDKEAIFTTLVNAIKELKQEIDTLKN